MICDIGDGQTRGDHAEPLVEGGELAQKREAMFLRPVSARLAIERTRDKVGQPWQIGDRGRLSAPETIRDPGRKVHDSKMQGKMNGV